MTDVPAYEAQQALVYATESHPQTAETSPPHSRAARVHVPGKPHAVVLQ